MVAVGGDLRQYSDTYLYKTARSVGVALDDLDDCVQELRLRLWLRPDAGPLDLRYWAIDFQRKQCHGWRTRTYRPNAVLDEHAYALVDPLERLRVVEDGIDFENCWGKLTSVQQDWLIKGYNGQYRPQISRSRRKLKEMWASR